MNSEDTTDVAKDAEKAENTENTEKEIEIIAQQKENENTDDIIAKKENEKQENVETADNESNIENPAKNLIDTIPSELPEEDVTNTGISDQDKEQETVFDTEQESEPEPEPKPESKAKEFEPVSKQGLEPESKAEKFEPESKQEQPEQESKPEELEPEPETKLASEPETKLAPEPEKKLEPTAEEKLEPEVETQQESEPQPSLEQEPEPKSEFEPEPELEQGKETGLDPELQQETNPEHEDEQDNIQKIENEEEIEVNSDQQSSVIDQQSEALVPNIIIDEQENIDMDGNVEHTETEMTEDTETINELETDNQDEHINDDKNEQNEENNTEIEIDNENKMEDELQLNNNDESMMENEPKEENHTLNSKEDDIGIAVQMIDDNKENASNDMLLDDKMASISVPANTDNEIVSENETMENEKPKEENHDSNLENETSEILVEDEENTMNDDLLNTDIIPDPIQTSTDIIDQTNEEEKETTIDIPTEQVNESLHDEQIAIEDIIDENADKEEDEITIVEILIPSNENMQQEEKPELEINTEEDEMPATDEIIDEIEQESAEIVPESMSIPEERTEDIANAEDVIEYEMEIDVETEQKININDEKQELEIQQILEKKAEEVVADVFINMEMIDKNFGIEKESESLINKDVITDIVLEKENESKPLIVENAALMIHDFDDEMEEIRSDIPQPIAIANGNERELHVKQPKIQENQNNMNQSKITTKEIGTQTIILSDDIKLSSRVKKRIAMELGTYLFYMNEDLKNGSKLVNKYGLDQVEHRHQPQYRKIISQLHAPKNSSNIRQSKSSSYKIASIMNEHKPQLSVIFDRYSNGLTRKIKLEGLTRMLKDRNILSKLSLVPEITKAFHKSSFKESTPSSLNFDEFIQCIIRLSNELLSKKKKAKYKSADVRVSLFLERMQLRSFKELNVKTKVSKHKSHAKQLDYRLTEKQLDSEFDKYFSSAQTFFMSDNNSLSSNSARMKNLTQKNLLMKKNGPISPVYDPMISPLMRKHSNRSGKQQKKSQPKPPSKQRLPPPIRQRSRSTPVKKVNQNGVQRMRNKKRSTNKKMHTFQSYSEAFSAKQQYYEKGRNLNQDERQAEPVPVRIQSPVPVPYHIMQHQNPIQNQPRNEFNPNMIRSPNNIPSQHLNQNYRSYNNNSNTNYNNYAQVSPYYYLPNNGSYDESIANTNGLYSNLNQNHERLTSDEQHLIHAIQQKQNIQLNRALPAHGIYDHQRMAAQVQQQMQPQYQPYQQYFNNYQK